MFASCLFKGSKFLFQMIVTTFMLGVGCYISCEFAQAQCLYFIINNFIMFASCLFKGSKFLFQMIVTTFMLGVGCYISCLLVVMQAETRWVG